MANRVDYVNRLKGLVLYYGSMRNTAKSFGVNVSTISRIISGKTKHTQYAKRINNRFHYIERTRAVQVKVQLRTEELSHPVWVSTKVVKLSSLADEASLLVETVGSRYKYAKQIQTKLRQIKY